MCVCRSRVSVYSVCVFLQSFFEWHFRCSFYIVLNRYNDFVAACCAKKWQRNGREKNMGGKNVKMSFRWMCGFDNVTIGNLTTKARFYIFRFAAYRAHAHWATGCWSLFPHHSNISLHASILTHSFQCNGEEMWSSSSSWMINLFLSNNSFPPPPPLLSLSFALTQRFIYFGFIFNAREPKTKAKWTKSSGGSALRMNKAKQSKKRQTKPELTRRWIECWKNIKIRNE